MRTKFPFGLFVLLVVVILIVACQSTPAPRAKPQAMLKQNSSPTAPAVSATAQATPMASTVPEVPAQEEDCMAGCHVPDANETFANGADPQPADHAGYKTCVECHLKLTKPAYPDTHAGRMDPACPLCHVLETKTN